MEGEVEMEEEVEGKVEVQVPLPEVPLLHVFSFLDAVSLLRAGQVSKYWNRLADDQCLWRSLCRSRWPGSWEAPQELTWKQLLLTHARRERRMARARPQDFAYREARSRLGILKPLAYLSGSGPTLSGQRSIVCSASTRRMLFAWDVQEGSMIWVSPVQETAIMYLATLPQQGLAVTVDHRDTVKVWNCRAADALAARSMPKPCLSLEAFLAGGRPVAMVGDSAGDIYTLTVPELTSVSCVHAFDHTVNHLHCSPDGKWVFASATLQLMMPKVFATESLLRPEDSTGLWASLQLAFCSKACWALKRANRVTMMFQKSSFRRTGFSTFDLAARSSAGGTTVVEAHQVASFMLPNRMERPFHMGVQDGAAIVLQSGAQLLLFSIHGTLLQRFEDHQRSICHLWTDSLRVLTTSMDDFLHLYMWEEGGRGPSLRSCCHLEQRRDDPTPSCFPSLAACDNNSIVCVVSRSRETSVLVMYSLPPL